MVHFHLWMLSKTITDHKTRRKKLRRGHRRRKGPIGWGLKQQTYHCSLVESLHVFVSPSMAPNLRLNAVAFVSPLNHPILIRTFIKQEEHAIKYHYIAHTSLDIIEERGKPSL